MGENKSFSKVIFGDVSELGNYLTTSVTTLNDKLDCLSGKIASLDSSWLDADGESYVSKFNRFINNSKSINKEIDGLGKYASKMAEQYESILKNHLSRM